MCDCHDPKRRQLILASLMAGALAACGQSGQTETATLTPAEIEQGTACALDGMLLADYPGPKAQIHYAGVDKPDFFCDVIELFSIYLRPEQVRTVTAMYVQDTSVVDWDQPTSGWIDAKSAWYVVGSHKRGAMGPTFAPFSKEADARTFAQQHGGEVVRFADVTPDMATLDGGALHDHSM